MLFRSGQEDEEIELTVEEKLASELVEVGDRIFFGYDESIITDQSADTLQQQYQFLIRNPDLSITITGHCDERGTREYNLALGERRASAAKNYLISLGISSNRISVISYGKEKPPKKELNCVRNEKKKWKIPQK